MKQCRMSDETHEELKVITDYKKAKSPYKGVTITMQFALADLIAREAARIKKILGE